MGLWQAKMCSFKNYFPSNKLIKIEVSLRALNSASVVVSGGYFSLYQTILPYPGSPWITHPLSAPTPLCLCYWATPPLITCLKCVFQVFCPKGSVIVCSLFLFFSAWSMQIESLFYRICKKWIQDFLRELHFPNLHIPYLWNENWKSIPVPGDAATMACFAYNRWQIAVRMEGRNTVSLY